MTLNNNIYQKRLDKRLNEFLGQFMSDTKWTKLFKLLSLNYTLVSKCLVKDVLDDILRQIEIPKMENFTDIFDKTGFRDVMTGGPSTFKQIQWIEFPNSWEIQRQMRMETLEPLKYYQDILRIKILTEQIGKVETEFDNERFVVYGYK